MIRKRDARVLEFANVSEIEKASLAWSTCLSFFRWRASCKNLVIGDFNWPWHHFHHHHRPRHHYLHRHYHYQYLQKTDLQNLVIGEPNWPRQEGCWVQFLFLQSLSWCKVTSDFENKARQKKTITSSFCFAGLVSLSFSICNFQATLVYMDEHTAGSGNISAEERWTDPSL